MIQKIKNDLNTAMKAGDTLKVSVLRMLLSELNYKKIDLQRELKDEDVPGVVGKEVKKRREAIEAYTAAGRQAAAETERKELEILQEYMPEQLSEQEIEKEIEGILATIPERDFGQVMKTTAPLFKGRADGRMVAEIVRKILSN